MYVRSWGCRCTTITCTYSYFSSLSRPRKEKKPDDLTPLECISFIHEEYIRPICEQSGLPGLTYKAGPMVENCKMKDISSHSAGVLAAVRFPGSVSSKLEESDKCEMATCVEEYNIEEVYFLTCKLCYLKCIPCSQIHMHLYLHMSLGTRMLYAIHYLHVFCYYNIQLLPQDIASGYK